jgi:hypothetical protein
MNQFQPVNDEPQAKVIPMEIDSPDEVLGVLKAVLVLIGLVLIAPALLGFLSFMGNVYLLKQFN